MKLVQLSYLLQRLSVRVFEGDAERGKPKAACEV